MARNYGRTVTSIWRDPDFLMLGSDARFAYVMLFNQPKISAAGVLEVTARRWADNLGYGMDRLEAALAELLEHRYIVVDDRAEELFVRSFVRHDGGVNNDLRRKAILSSTACVVSGDIRASIAVELDRLGIAHDVPKPYRDGIESGRVVVPLTDQGLDPQPLIHNGGTEAPADAGPPSMFCDEHPNGTTEPCGGCARAREVYAAAAQAKLAEGISAAQARIAAIEACDMCDEHGKRVDSKGRILARVCDHVPLSSSVGAV